MKNLDSSYGFSVAIGHKPNTDILKTFFPDETGYIINVVNCKKI
jgi:thioredoxin reductase